MGEGSERKQWHLLHSLLDFNHSLCYPQSKWALLMLLPGWVGLCTFQAPVGLSKEISCEAGSFSCCRLNPHRCFQSEVSGFISRSWSPGLHGLPPQLSLPVYLHANVGSPALPPATLPAPVHQLPPCHVSSPPRHLSPFLLLVWVNECFLFNSLVVRLPYSLIFCQF